MHDPELLERSIIFRNHTKIRSLECIDTHPLDAFEGSINIGLVIYQGTHKDNAFLSRS